MVDTTELRPAPEHWLHPEKWSKASDQIGSVVIASALEKNPALGAAVAFERLIDPENKLPKVDLMPTMTKDHLSRSFWTSYDIYANSRQIGYCNLAFDSPSDKAYFPEIMLGVDNKMRLLLDGNGEKIEVTERGFGQSVYKKVISEALQQGYGFRSYDKGLSKGGYELWLSLVKKGVARLVKPGQIDPDNGRIFGYSNATFEILTPEELVQA